MKDGNLAPTQAEKNIASTIRSLLATIVEHEREIHSTRIEIERVQSFCDHRIKKAHQGAWGDGDKCEVCGKVLC